MKRVPFACVLLTLLLGHPLSAQIPDPVIDTLIDRVSLDRMHADIDTLVSFGTRRSDTPGGLDAQNFVHDRLEELGFTDLYVQDFDANTDNVVAVYPGLVAPDEIYILGAHYDSVNSGGAGLPAPGADDNGTGTAALLEIARVLQESGVRFEATITLVAFASEEFGRLGSIAFVDDAIATGKIPETAIVMDVMGYLEPDTDPDLSFGTPNSADPIPGTLEFVDTIVEVIEGYFPGIPWEYGDTCT